MDSAESLPSEFFESLYKENPDPWQFKTSEYESQKYLKSLSVLSQKRYESVLEIGGSIGVFTEQLAERCQNLLSVDVSDTAQKQAIQRCSYLSNISFKLMSIPQEFPNQLFDLIILSEVGYYWSLPDLRKAQRLMIDHLQPKGEILLVHWIADAEILPITGDQVHNAFMELVPRELTHSRGFREQKYRLDLLEKY